MNNFPLKNITIHIRTHKKTDFTVKGEQISRAMTNIKINVFKEVNIKSNI